MAEHIYLTFCYHCKKNQQVISMKDKFQKKSKICCYCGKSFTVSRENIIAKLK